jgi:multidrug efflux pump subunit AcrB
MVREFANNRVFANLAMLFILLAGSAAGFMMTREDLPNMKEDYLEISVSWPGADPREVEEGISRKIEDAIGGLEGIKSYTTDAVEGQGQAMLIVRRGYDADELLERVRTRVSAISEFPEDAKPPIIDRPVHREAVMVLALSANISERRLLAWASKVCDEIRRLEGVSQVDLVGTRPHEIAVEVKEETLRRFGITFPEVAAAIRRSNLNLAGGTIRSRGEEIRARTVGRKDDAESLAAIAVRADSDGVSIPLGQLAEIRDGFADDVNETKIDGVPGVLVTVFKTDREDAIQIADEVREYVDRHHAALPVGSQLSILYDASEAVRSRIAILIKNGLYGLLIVAILLWLFLDMRLAFWVAMGIPISLAGGLAFLWWLGESINMVSLFSMILVLGIVADDAIVVGEAIHHHRQQGATPLDAAVNGVREVGLPVALALFTSIIAFLPLAFIEGMMGKFIAILPVTAITCLLVSLAECLLLLPAHLNHTDASTQRRHKGFRQVLNQIPAWLRTGMNRLALEIYKPLICAILKWRYLCICGAFSLMLISAGLITSGCLKLEVLPPIEGDSVTATVVFPEGASPERTRKALNTLYEAILSVGMRMESETGTPLIAHVITMVGLVSDDDIGDVEAAGGHCGSIQVILTPAKERGIHTEKILVYWKDATAPIFGVRSVVFFGKEEGGQGDPIQIQVAGREMGPILDAAKAVTEHLQRFDGVYQVRSDYAPAKKEVRFQLKPEAHYLGIRVADVAAKVNNAYFGEEVVTLQRGRDEVKIRLRYSQSERRQISSLETMRLSTPDGHMVPLDSIARMEFVPGAVAISRKDGRRIVTVRAEVDTTKVTAGEITAELTRTFLDQLDSVPSDVHIELAGEKEEEGDAFGSLIIGFPLALLGIYLLLASFFRSYFQPMMILFAIPFGIIGSIWGHLGMGIHLSLMSIFGMVALTGVVVNDAILIITRINQFLAEGMMVVESVVTGGIRRFRAVMLTSLSTIGGLTPLLLEKSLHAQLLIPVALSLAAGLLLATLLTLVLIPCLFLILNDLRSLTERFRTGHWASRERVEPHFRARPERNQLPRAIIDSRKTANCRN